MPSNYQFDTWKQEDHLESENRPSTVTDQSVGKGKRAPLADVSTPAANTYQEQRF